MWALKTAGLTFHYPDLHLFDQLELELQPGELRAILGPSGSGKTTLIHLLAGILPLQAGKLWWENVEVSKFDEEKLARLRREKVGLIFQHHYLIDELTAIENVMIPGLISGSADKKRAYDLLQNIGLQRQADLLPSELSGGERQRVAIARAIYPRPKVILADEPTGSLDRKNAEQSRDLLAKLARENDTAVLLATHDETLVAEWPVWRLENGRLN